ncbi:MAG: CoA-binding protein [Thermoplasmata archaeon]|nr:CoA-binding protein [Thermoplasmata archaeon]
MKIPKIRAYVLDGLAHAFNPKSIAVVGASRSSTKVGWNIIKKLREDGYKGKIYPVNPRAHPYPIFGEKTYKTVRDIPEPVDLVVIAVPFFLVKSVMKDCVANGAKIAVVISSGFKEVGAKELEEEITNYCRNNGFPFIGPNLLGLGNTHSNLNLGFMPYLPKKGNVAIFSQSGANLLAWLGMSRTQRLGISLFTGLGNMADIGFPEFIIYAGKDKNTKVIALYIEGLQSKKEFIKACQEVVPKKPIIALAAGSESTKGKSAAAAHTGSTALTSEEYDKLFEEAGIIRVRTQQEFVDVALALSMQPLPKGGWVFITNGGGSGVLATDECARRGLDLLEIKGFLKQQMRAAVGPLGSPLNPVDLTGMATWRDYKMAMEAAITNPDVGGIVVSVCPTSITYPEKIAVIIYEIYKKYKDLGKPIIAQFQGGPECERANNWLKDRGIPSYLTPEQAVAGMAALSKYAEIKSKFS